MHIELLLNIIVIDLLHLLLHITYCVITYYEEYYYSRYSVFNKYMLLLNIKDLFYCTYYYILLVFEKCSNRYVMN